VSACAISGFKLETIVITFARSTRFIMPRPCAYTMQAIAEMARMRICVPSFISVYSLRRKVFGPCAHWLTNAELLAAALIMRQDSAHGTRLASKMSKAAGGGAGPVKGWELVIPNPKLKLMDQLREVLRLKFTPQTKGVARMNAVRVLRGIALSCFGTHRQGLS
jgi:hypothetical protein